MAATDNPPTELTPEQNAFLDDLGQHGSIKRACESVGIDPDVVDQWATQEPFRGLCKYWQNCGKREASQALAAAHREKLTRDPRMALLAFVAVNLLDLRPSDLQELAKIDQGAMKHHLDEVTCRFQQLSALPMSVCIAELRRMAA